MKKRKVISVDKEWKKFNRNEKIINICEVILMICLILDIILMPTWIILKALGY